jgi:hypothetical protein
VSCRYNLANVVVPQFPSDIHFLPLLADLLSPPTSPSSSTTPATPHHPLLSTDEAWEIRSVLLLWLSLLLTVPFNLSALSSDMIPISCSIDYTAQQRLFAIPAAGLTRQVILLAVPLLFRPGKEGAYAALVLARLYSREDAAPGLPGFLDWAGQELREGEQEGEANLIASIFELLAVLPTLIRPERLDILEEFMDEVLLPHLRGSRTAATSGLIRKLAIKAKGRWWVARIGSKRCESFIKEWVRKADSLAEDDLPDSIEDLIGDLMSGLGDKVSIIFSHNSADCLGHDCPLLCCQVSGENYSHSSRRLPGTDRRRYSGSLWRDRRRTGHRKLFRYHC